MEQKISGREIMLFITMFRLWDAYLDDDDGAIDLRAPGYGCDECSYTLYKNGKYEIEAWVVDKMSTGEATEGHWEFVQKGDIFDKVDRP